MYIGNMIYKDINFDFSLCNGELLLCPIEADEDKARALVGVEIANGAWASLHTRESIEQDWLWAEPRNSHYRLALFPVSKNFDRESILGDSFTCQIGRYFSFFTSELKVDKIQFRSKLFDYLLDTRSAVVERSQDENGSHGIKFNPIVLDNQSFVLDGVEVGILLITTIIYSGKAGEPSMYASSYLELAFPETDDYSFVNKLIYQTEKVMQFCAYAKEFEFDEIELLHASTVESSSGEQKLHYRQVAIVSDEPLPSYCIPERIKKERYVPFGMAPGFEKNLFQSTIDKSLSIDHIPECHNEANRYSKTRIVILAAAFDWSFSKLFPEGVAHVEKSTEATKTVVAALTDLISKEDQSKKVVEQATRVIKILQDGDSYASKMIYFAKQYPEVFELLGKELYEQEDLAFNIGQITERTQKLRNALAHGNQDFAIDITVLIDSIFLERIVLAMQLLYLGVGDKETVVSIVKKARG